MPTYVTLTSWTQKGIEQAKDSASRYDAARKFFESQGAKIKAFYLVMGEFDFVIITEAPNDETIARANLALASKGFVRTRTMRAFDENEYRKLVGGLA